MPETNTEDALGEPLATFRTALMGFENAIGTCFTNAQEELMRTAVAVSAVFVGIPLVDWYYDRKVKRALRKAVK